MCNDGFIDMRVDLCKKTKVHKKFKEMIGEDVF